MRCWYSVRLKVTVSSGMVHSPSVVSTAARGHFGDDEVALAAAVGITQAYLAQIERGVRTGDIQLYARLGKKLRVRIEDLVPSEPPPA